LCPVCSEEIIDEREVLREGVLLCRGCAGFANYLGASRATEVSGSHDVRNSVALHHD
jgi:hypothetical protein